MIWIYLIAATLIAWGIARDLSRGETWMLGFGAVIRRSKPGVYWLTICLRGFIFLVVILAAYLRIQG